MKYRGQYGVIQNIGVSMVWVGGWLKVCLPRPMSDCVSQYLFIWASLKKGLYNVHIVHVHVFLTKIELQLYMTIHVSCLPELVSQYLVLLLHISDSLGEFRFPLVETHHIVSRVERAIWQQTPSLNTTCLIVKIHTDCKSGNIAGINVHILKHMLAAI